jgi:hypothetical protein
MGMPHTSIQSTETQTPHLSIDGKLRSPFYAPNSPIYHGIPSSETPRRQQMHQLPQSDHLALSFSSNLLAFIMMLPSLSVSSMMLSIVAFANLSLRNWKGSRCTYRLSAVSPRTLRPLFHWSNSFDSLARVPYITCNSTCSP